MTKNQEIEIRNDRDEKKAYVRPQLIKHGNVETLTQGQHSYPSGPIRWSW